MEQASATHQEMFKELDGLNDRLSRLEVLIIAQQKRFSIYLRRMPRKFNYVRAAAALVEASLKSDREVALAFGVAVRTLEYWRHRLKSDEVLQQEFRKMAQEKLAQWVSEIPDSLGMAIGFITSAARSGDVTDPKMVEAMVGAISVLSEVLVLASAIEQRRSGDE